jgi:hypothetical protein
MKLIKGFIHIGEKMTKDDLAILVDIRAHLIEVYNFLDAKNEPAAVVKQADIARELAVIIPKIDKILSGKVKFA